MAELAGGSLKNREPLLRSAAFTPLQWPSFPPGIWIVRVPRDDRTLKRRNAALRQQLAQALYPFVDTAD